MSCHPWDAFSTNSTWIKLPSPIKANDLRKIIRETIPDYIVIVTPEGVRELPDNANVALSTLAIEKEISLIWEKQEKVIKRGVPIITVLYTHSKNGETNLDMPSHY